MSAVMIEVTAPCCHQIAGMPHAVEQALVEAFVANPAIEAFHEAVLHKARRAGCVRKGNRELDVRQVFDGFALGMEALLDVDYVGYPIEVTIIHHVDGPLERYNGNDSSH